MTTEVEGQERISLAWDDVLSKTGAAAQRKGLEEFKDQLVRLYDFRDEQRGRKTKRAVMTAKVQTEAEFHNGGASRTAIIPVRYASRMRERLGQIPPDQRVNVDIWAKIEVGEHGAMIKPVAKPEPKPESEKRGRFGRKRRDQPQGDQVAA